MPSNPLRSRPRRRPAKLPARVREDLDRFSYERPEPEGSLFAWTIVILLLVGVALACWICSFYIFAHPEKSFGYSILSKLKKIEPPQRFEITAAPQGRFFTAKQLLDKYGRLTPRELAKTNDSLLRDYIRNYKLTQDAVPYVTGSFTILSARPLNDGNLFTSGLVALAQSTDTPQVLIEHVFTAGKDAVPLLQRMNLTGLSIQLTQKYDLEAVVHASRLEDGRMLFTVVPILYPSYTSTESSVNLTLEPPLKLDVKAGLPVLSGQEIASSDTAYNSYRHRLGLDIPPQASQASSSPTATPAPPQLIRIHRPAALAADGRPLPVSQAPEEPSPTATPEPVVKKAVRVHETAKVSPTPAASPKATAVPEEETAMATATPEASLKPFLTIAATPTPTPAMIMASTTGDWPTYSPGEMPRGRLLNVRDVESAPSDGVASERSYLQGHFVVTASGQKRAILRYQGNIADVLGLGHDQGKVRVIVDYPAGIEPPGEGATLSRDARRPFLITHIKKVDGMINVYALEVTKP